jgi:hypothetical protein
MDSAGDKVYEPGADSKCLAEGKVTKVIDSSGTEVLSSTVLYFDGAEIVSSNDTITYFNNDYPIKAIGEFFENGARSIWVVHL